jgi:F-type H+-transporting ATPase subunit epsilon
MNVFQAQILTPDGPVFDGKVESIRMPGTEGDFQVLINHANLMSSLDIGPVTIVDAVGKVHKFAISGGMVDVNNNVVSLFAEAAEPSNAIDIDRARASKARAEQRVKDLNMDHIRAQASLQRAVNRLKVAGR